MPDPATILTAAISAAVVAAAVACIAWPWRHCHPWYFSGAGAFGTGAALVVGAYLLGVTPNWPPGEDLDRLLIVVVPGVVAVELVAMFARRKKWFIGSLRIVFERRATD